MGKQYKWIIRNSIAGSNINHLEEIYIYAQGIESTRKQAIEKARQSRATSTQIIRVWRIDNSK